MTTVDRIIERQYEMVGTISRALSNLKKVGSANITRSIVQSRLEALKSNWCKFQNNHEELFRIRNDEDKKLAYFSENIYARCEEAFVDAHGEMLEILSSFDRQVIEKSLSSNDTTQNASSHSSSRRLPRLDLPKFSGNFSEWSHFRDLFESMVIDNDDISLIEKLQYLKMSLSGQPLQLLKKFKISKESFKRAWDTLVKRYENKRVLIDTQLAELFAARKVKADCAFDLKRLLGDVTEALGALNDLGCPVEYWDHLIVFLVCQKLDADTLKDWEKMLGAQSTSPSFADLEAFLVDQIHTLDALERAGTVRKQQSTNSNSTRNATSARVHTTSVPDRKCSFCSSDHYIAFCPKFLEQTADQRQAFVMSNKLCFNCLGPHALKSCHSSKRCRICNKQHHSTLHHASRSSIATSSSTSTTAVSHAPTTKHLEHASDASTAPLLPGKPAKGPEGPNLVAHSRLRNAPVLLATAIVSVVSKTGETLKIRALLDQGSEVSIVSESIAQLLRLPRRPSTTPIIGIGAQNTSVSNGIVSLQIGSIINPAVSISFDALVLPKLTAALPPKYFTFNYWHHLANLPLADPHFNSPGKIELILGAEVYSQIIEDGIRKGRADEPIAQKTALGWVLSGSVASALTEPRGDDLPVHGLQCSIDVELLELMQRFWSQEEVATSAASILTQDETQCEEHFQATHSRDQDGRFVVKLPLKRAVSVLGDSRSPALNALVRLEKRFNKDSSLENAYSEFLREYRELNHMQPCSPSANHSNSREYYLPHHGVVRATSSTTKLRVVFNASQKTNRGISLNDCLHTGPKLQTDVSDILTRWRRHKFVFATDIEKMYRQIRVHNDDQPLQKILWRSSPQDPLQEYQLCTVTYGLACAPYLALRCLHQLAQDCDPQYSHAKNLIRRDTYVDDIFSGASDASTAKLKMQQLRDVLKAGGFELKKWTSNNPDLLADIPLSDLAPTNTLLVEDNRIHHTLGVQWNCKTDAFLFSTPSAMNPDNSYTKRSVLSFISRIFDPLGWIAPITVTAKMFLQELWAIRLDWDEELPDTLQSRWKSFIQQCESIGTLSIPRWIGMTVCTTSVELHGFSDASQAAIAAVTYIRVQSDSGAVQVFLLSAKTKVAPLKPTTIPRLELSAAVLLARQIVKIQEVLELQAAPIHLWTDSTVALTWIKGHPSRWKDFVRNRVSFIQELTSCRWHHVPGKENPADIASRGLAPHKLKQEELWWSGPQWLRQESDLWPSSTPIIKSGVNLEERSVACSTSSINPDSEVWELVLRYSSLSRLLRITAWIRRAISRWQHQSETPSSNLPLSAAELESALILWTKLIQQAYFQSEIQILTSRKPLPSSNSLFRLSPILDSEGLLRLRGRLQHSQLDSEVKNPLILPRASPLTRLVIDHYHRQTLHGGPQLTLSTIRQKFWIIGGRVPIRSFIHQCMICVRHRASASQQVMGQLPASRVTQSRPFLHSGIDYAGPLTLKTHRGRGAKTYKAYFIRFVCFSSSAIHLEVATDYSSEGFIAAYRRFVARRGICSSLTSDCGTNLIGADAELKRMFKASSREWAHISSLLANDRVTWKFNPPSAPHFGGKWEAGVKSVKFHLRRIIGDTPLTYEELSTLLTQIEAILNSRPLTALSEDPSDVSALTPGHFLIGSPLTAIPEPSHLNIAENRLTRWQLVQKMKDHFWQRWSLEYLHELQTHSKWHRSQTSLKAGALVLIKDERFPPTKWPLARVVDVHPGADGLVRVATVKTATSTLKRPIVKLCQLPLDATS